MIVKIDKHGHLYINRKGGWLVQRCPWTADEDGECCRCGDWCPHFGEPVSYYPEYKKYTKYTIAICHNKNISCDKLIDERDERGDKAIKEMPEVEE